MRTVHIQLGRNGDLILLLPCWRKLFLDTGQKPVVMVAREFCGALNGASYVESDILNAHWYGGMPEAKKLAAFKYGAYTVTQCHGFEHGCDMGAYSTFGETMWARAGFTSGYGTLPMIFDRRNKAREQTLIDKHYRGKPMLLFNFSGNSSPLPCSGDLRNRLRRYERYFTGVNLAAINADHIYDLLGLYDKAAALVTIDTSTLHLAAASSVPTLAYLRGGWNSAIAKAGAVGVPYDQAHAKLDAIDQFLQSVMQRQNEHLPLLHGLHAAGPGNHPAQLHSASNVEGPTMDRNTHPRR